MSTAARSPSPRTLAGAVHHLAQDRFRPRHDSDPRQRNPKIPDVPTLFELMDQYKTPDTKRRQALVYLGASGFGSWPIVSTPGLPADRASILREAYGKTLKDPDFIDEAKKRGWELRPVSGEELQALAKEVIDQPPEVIEWLKSFCLNDRRKAQKENRNAPSPSPNPSTLRALKRILCKSFVSNHQRSSMTTRRRGIARETS
jgi:hypothetical protein